MFILVCAISGGLLFQGKERVAVLQLSRGGEKASPHFMWSAGTKASALAGLQSTQPRDGCTFALIRWCYCKHSQRCFWQKRKCNFIIFSQSSNQQKKAQLEALKTNHSFLKTKLGKNILQNLL